MEKKKNKKWLKIGFILFFLFLFFIKTKIIFSWCLDCRLGDQCYNDGDCGYLGNCSRYCTQFNGYTCCYPDPPTPTPTPKQNPTPTSAPPPGGGAGTSPGVSPGVTTTPMVVPECNQIPPPYYENGSCDDEHPCSPGGNSVQCVNGKCRYYGLHGCPEGAQCPTDWRPIGWSCSAGCPFYHMIRSCNNGQLADSGEKLGPCPAGTNLVQDFPTCQTGVSFSNLCVQWSCSAPDGTADLMGWLINQDLPDSDERAWQGWVRLLTSTGNCGNNCHEDFSVDIYSTSPEYGGGNYDSFSETAKVLINGSHSYDNLFHIGGLSIQAGEGIMKATYLTMNEVSVHSWMTGIYAPNITCINNNCGVNGGIVSFSQVVDKNLEVAQKPFTTGGYYKFAIQGLNQNWVFGKSSYDKNIPFGTGPRTICLRALVRQTCYKNEGASGDCNFLRNIKSNELCLTRPESTPTPYPTIKIYGNLKERLSSSSCQSNISTNHISINLNPQFPNSWTPTCYIYPQETLKKTNYECFITVPNNSEHPSQNLSLNASASGYGAGYWTQNNACSITPLSSLNNVNVACSGSSCTVFNQDIFFPFNNNWIKLKNTSFISNAINSNIIPLNIIAYDGDDDANQRYLIIDEAGLIEAYNLDLGTAGASKNNWWIFNYSTEQPVFTPASFFEYIKARKKYKEVSNNANLSEISEGGIYYLKTDSPFDLDNNSLSQITASKFILIVRGDVNINGNVFNIENDCVTTSISKSLAIIASGNIQFSNTLKCAAGLFIGQSVNLGTTNNQGLKIKGNLISFSNVVNSRNWDTTSKPSLFVVFEPKFYLDLLPWLSNYFYDWRELTP